MKRKRSKNIFLRNKIKNNHYYIKDFARNCPIINRGGNKFYISSKIPEYFRRQPKLASLESSIYRAGPLGGPPPKMRRIFKADLLLRGLSPKNMPSPA